MTLTIGMLMIIEVLFKISNRLKVQILALFSSMVPTSSDHNLTLESLSQCQTCAQLVTSMKYPTQRVIYNLYIK